MTDPIHVGKNEVISGTDNQLRKKSTSHSMRSTVKHYLRPPEDPFTESQRATTTVLIGGLSPAHDYLIEAALQRLGLTCKALPNTNLHAFQLGREYGNNGYCNPTYYTTGNLIRYLQNLHANGMSKREIIDNHVFFTAGCNGPCRFGMIEAQYRLALRNAGFEGFRILLFSKSEGVNQDLENVAIDINLEFYLTVVNVINIADLINAMVFSIRPFEVEKGKTDRVRQEVLDYLHEVVRTQKRINLKPFWKRFFTRANLVGSAEFLHKLFHQLSDNYLIDAMDHVRKLFSTIEVDQFRFKTKVKVMGEFWVQSTHSDGNYNMHPFLEGEGAEVQIDPLACYLAYMLSKHLVRHKARKGINAPPWWKAGKVTGYWLKYWKTFLALYLGDKLYRREVSRLEKALGGTAHLLVPQKELQDLADPYYTVRLDSGEGYMEVGKNLYYHTNELSHMNLSLKPFGCMPSTLSDGAQIKVIEDYKDIIFLPVETSGEGEINAHSRVQMALTDARDKARQEFKRAKENCSSSMEELQAYVAAHPELKDPTRPIPRTNGVIGTAANFILHVDTLMNQPH